MQKINIYSMILLFILTGCVSLSKSTNTNNNEVFNVFKNKFSYFSIEKEAFFSSKKPQYLLDQYDRLKTSNKNSTYYSLYSKALILDTFDIFYMREKYKDWAFKDWNISNKGFFQNKKFIRISAPIFNENKDKCLVLIYIEKDKSGTMSGYVLKKDEKWNIIGGFPIGIIN